MIDLNKLENVQDKGNTIIAACPCCRIDNGSDKSGNHLIIYKNTNKFGCCVDQSKEHYKRIIELVGVKGEVQVTTSIAPEPILQNPEKIFDKSCLNKLLPKWDLLLERNITRETLKEFKIGFASSGKLRLRYVAPVYNQYKKIHGFWGRYYKANPPEKIAKYLYFGKKSGFIWPRQLNEEILKKTKEIYLVESPLDILYAWGFGYKNILCLFGVSLSTVMLNYLISINPSKIYISTNNEDSQIGNNAAIKIKEKLDKFFNPNKVVIKLPIKKDLCEMNQEQLSNWYDN